MTEPAHEPQRTVACSRERLTDLARDPAFHCLMRLSLHVNALRFAQAALFHADADDGPIGLRARPAAFFYHSSVLFEALQLIPELRTHFESNPHWSRSFGMFGSDPEIRALLAQGTDLHRVRNHIGFHVRPMVPERSLPTLDLPEYIIVRGHGTTVGQIYHELADNMALHYFLQSPRTYSALLQEFADRATPITNLLMRFLDAADILIPRALEVWGLRARRLQPPPRNDSNDAA